MHATQNSAAIRDLRTLFGVGSLGTLSDGQLLDRFAGQRDEAAFEALVLRHGPMVWGVCRRILRNHHDAEDALQATFLVLARKAPSVLPREMLANWLYGVACQTALKARTTMARRHAREKAMREMPETEAAYHVQDDERLPLLDQELSRLPERYRAAIVLCDLEGKTHRDAASQLGWPIGTLSGRLSRGRDLLRKRLTRRGLSVPVGALVPSRASVGLSAPLVSATTRAARMIATGQTVSAGLISARVLRLSEEVVKSMLFARLGILVVVLAMATTTGGLAFRTHGSEMAGRLVAPGTNTTILAAQEGKETPSRQKDARGTVEAFIAALSEGKLKEAARFCWTEEYDEATLRGYRQALGGKRPSVDSVDIIGDVALVLSVKMTLKAEDSGDENPEIEARLLLLLSRRDGDWQIQVIGLGPALRMERDRLRFRAPFLDPEGTTRER